MKQHPRRRTNGHTPGAEQQASSELRETSTPECVEAPVWGRLVISAFILWNLFAITVWLLPRSVLRQKCVPVVHPYMVFTGLAQNWGMFSPNPSDVDLYWVAQITYADGQTRSWSFPRMVDLGYVERYRRERFRKMIEFANPDKNRGVWPALARYAARRNYENPRNPPVAVELVRHFRFVPPPGGEFGPYRTYSILKTDISSEDLR